MSGKFSGYLPIPWSDYFTTLDSALSQSYAVADHLQVVNSSASIPATPISNQLFSGGLFRVAFYLVELQADNVSSNVQLSIGWTDRLNNRSIAAPAVTTNAISAAQTGTYLLRCDRATPITFSTVYSSPGSTKMIYSLDLTLEQIVNLP